MAAAGSEDAEGYGLRVVALYDFDPSTIDWPFRRQKPLALQTGRVIEIIHDDGNEWALGHPVGQKDQRGYFPKNYTVSVAEYNDMMRDYHAAEQGPPPSEQGEARETLPPETRAIPASPLPAAYIPPTQESTAPAGGTFWREPEPELAYPGVAAYPVLVPEPPLTTTYELTKSRLLREMPQVPKPAPEEPAPPADDIAAALEEVKKEAAEKLEDAYRVPGGRITDSRQSTPATYSVTRPEQDFVRKSLPVDMQEKYLKKLSPLPQLIAKTFNREGCLIRDVQAMVAASKGPETNATTPKYSRFHDDKRLYTGVHAKGGPSTVEPDFAKGLRSPEKRGSRTETFGDTNYGVNDDEAYVSALVPIFRAFAHGREDMSGSEFARLCSDCSLCDGKAFVRGDVDSVFSQVTEHGKHRITLEQFENALRLIARKKGCLIREVHEMVAAREGPETHGTIPEFNKLHDDKSTYTGVHKEGGPSTIGPSPMEPNFPKELRVEHNSMLRYPPRHPSISSP
eukprot:gnl/TRDRNA2_/TRDRNA2_174652_c3_seq3.p1 gnl/TRDRNA2_/TRDRNA2_174652_c3~~gnl/TRDRNA2_/TRDRNA2_174652_c3_seq3.p1  ORF type:complete len:511 (+),score=87.65 gnl/TRDRNA2_/TRDRNA2_174652_c3_seq3:134-1666(+)